MRGARNQTGEEMTGQPRPGTQAVAEFARIPARPQVPAAAVAAGKSLMTAGGLDVGGIEYLEAGDGRLVFYDINANSNLRAPIAQAFGFDPFERVVDFLISQIGGIHR